jgi:DHA2 family multidrug resistance protein
MLVVGEFTKRIDTRVVIALGLVLFIWGAWWMAALNAEAGYWDIWWPRILQGVGLGFMFVPLTVATLADVPLANMSDATGILTLVRYLGGNIGIALLQVLQVRRAAAAIDTMRGNTTLASHPVAEAVHHFGVQHVALQLSGMIASNASLVSYLYLFRVSALIFAVCVPLLIFLPRQQR